MSFKLADHWVWDHWFLSSDEAVEMFFLRASRALVDPGRRHVRASIGHARSKDGGASWELLPDALVASDSPDFDDLATWTGSAIQLPNGGIRLFYTGISRQDSSFVQRIGWADSTDGIVFERKCSSNPKLALLPPLVADERWYRGLGNAPGSIAWRDPYVFWHEDKWHMFITAAHKPGVFPGDDEVGTIAHAVSTDLDHWQVLEPLTVQKRFREIECSQMHKIGNCWYLVFSCAPRNQYFDSDGYVWVLRAEDPLGPFDLSEAKYVSPTELYASQFFCNPQGEWALSGFHSGEDEIFTGTVPDPIPFDVVMEGLTGVH